MAKKFTAGMITQNPRTKSLYVMTGKGREGFRQDGHKTIVLADDLQILTTPDLPEGTTVRTEHGNLRKISRKRNSGSYWFTTDTHADLEYFYIESLPMSAGLFIAQNVPTLNPCVEHEVKYEQPQLVKIPAHVARAIEQIRKEHIESEDILIVDVMEGSAGLFGTIRQPYTVLRRYVRESVTNRKKYMQAVTIGYERDLTPREKIVQAIQDGVLPENHAIFTLEALGGFTGLIENIKADLGGR